jgi:Beta-propeller repeat
MSEAAVVKVSRLGRIPAIAPARRVRRGAYALAGLMLVPGFAGWGASAASAATTVAPSNLVYSTYFGGPGNDQGYMVAGAPDGGVFTTGFLTTSSGRIQSYAVDYSAHAQIVWNTAIADSGNVTVFYIRADTAGIYLAGVTTGADLPGATNADPAGSSKTGFLMVLDPATGAILHSMYLGGRGFSAANVDALDPINGDVYVGMSTGTQARLLLMDPTGTQVLWSMALGGKSASTHPYGMQTDASGNVAVATLTTSTIYPAVNAQQSLSGGGQDTGITELSPAGQILWSTYLGGSGEDRPNGLDIDAAGNVYVAGRTYSANFPLLNPLQQTNADDNAAYVTSYTSTGVMRYSTYFGGGKSEWFGGVSVAADGTAWVVGGTSSPDLPVVGGAPYVSKTGQYAYIAALAPDGSAVTYSSYLGGSRTDGASGAILVPGGLWMIGQTTSLDFPTIQPTQTTNAGAHDAWVALLKLA